MVEASLTGFQSHTTEVDIDARPATLDIVLAVSSLVERVTVTATKTGVTDIQSTPLAIAALPGKMAEQRWVPSRELFPLTDRPCGCTVTLCYISNTVMVMLFRPNPSLGVPIYLQLMEQVKHAIETGALRPGDQLPGIRPLAEELVINPNTVAKAYRELEHEGVIDLRHGAGAFVSGSARPKKATDTLLAGQAAVAAAVEKLRARGLTDEEIRRLFEAELAGLRRTGGRSV